MNAVIAGTCPTSISISMVKISLALLTAKYFHLDITRGCTSISVYTTDIAITNAH